MNQMPRRNSWPAREKRYDWFRVYNSFVGHPKFKVVAVACGITISEASMIGVALFTAANRAKPRGSVADFNAVETGAALDIPAEKVAQAYAKFEDMGWIDQDYMSTWDDRQPDKEDPTALERKRRQRDKLKKQRQGLAPAAKPDAPTSAPEASDEIAEARVWLISEAPKIVANALDVRELAAVATLTTWVNDIGKDYVALREILRGVIGQKTSAVSFRNQVGQRIKDHRLGPRLPLTMAAIPGRASSA